jgi:hypothetical protein
MEVYGGRNLMTPTLADVEQVAPGVGRMTCIECNGDQSGMRRRLAIKTRSSRRTDAWTARTEDAFMSVPDGLGPITNGILRAAMATDRFTDQA